MHRTQLVGAAWLALAALTAQEAPAPTARFTSLNRTFLVDLPPGWRQLAPNEARQLAADPATPPQWRTTAPHSFYAVGPVDRWLAGDVATPWLYVMEQDSEWHVTGDFAAAIAARWRENGAAQGVHHVVTDVRAAEVGPNAHPVWLAARTSTRDAGGRAIRSLDVYAPTGGRQVTLTFCAWAEDFERWAPEFERWLSTLTFARPSRGEQTLSDRLWTPLLTGGLVALVLLGLYKHSRRQR